MHILLAILGAVGALIFVVYRLTYIAREGQEVVSDAHGLYRRHQWNRKYSRNAINTLEDPREIAVLLMHETARYRGPLTEAQREAICEQATGHLGLSRADAEELLGAAAFMAQDITDIANVLTKVLRPLHNRLTDVEKRELVGMMAAVAEVDGEPDTMQVHLIARTREKLLPPH